MLEKLVTFLTLAFLLTGGRVHAQQLQQLGHENCTLSDMQQSVGVHTQHTVLADSYSINYAI